MQLIRGGWPFRTPPNVPFKLNKPKAEGLVGWWPAIASRGNIVREFTGFAGNAIPGSVPGHLVDSEMGPARDYDGSANYLSVSGVDTLANDRMSVSCWCNLDDLTVDSRLVTRWEAGAGTTHQFILWMDTGDGADGFAFAIMDDAASAHTTGATTASGTQGQTHHVVGTWDGGTLSVYVDGELKDSDPFAVTMQTSTRVVLIGAVSDDSPSGFTNGRIGDVRIRNYAMGAEEVLNEYLDPWDLYRPQVPGFWSIAPAAAPGDFTLTVQDGQHTQTGDSPHLSQDQFLTVADGQHTQTGDSPHLSQDQFLTAQDGQHTHTADNVVLTLATILVVQDGQHTQTADSPHLSQDQFLVVADGQHTQTADSPHLSQNQFLVVADGQHTHSGDNIVLVTAIYLIVQDGEHTHSADSPHLSQDQFLVVQDGEHQHIADGIIITEGEVLLVRPRSRWPFWS